MYDLSNAIDYRMVPGISRPVGSMKYPFVLWADNEFSHMNSNMAVRIIPIQEYSSPWVLNTLFSDMTDVISAIPGTSRVLWQLASYTSSIRPGWRQEANEGEQSSHRSS